MILKKTIRIVFLILLASLNSTAEEFHLRALGNLRWEPYRVTSSSTLIQGSIIHCDTSEKASYCASKFYTDVLFYGDAVKIEQLPGAVRLADGSVCQILSEKNRVYILFGPTEELLKKAVPNGKAPRIRAYPRWLDRFDNDAACMAFLGWGDKPADLDDDFRWARRYFSRFLLGGTFEQNYVAPGIFDTSTPDWTAWVGKKYDAAVDIYLASTKPGHPFFPLNIQPPLTVAPNTYLNKELNLRTQGMEQYEDAALYQFANHMKQYENYSCYFASAELGETSILGFTPLVDSAFLRQEWQKYLREKCRYTLKQVGEKHYNDANHFRSWKEVPVPTPADFAGWNPATCLNLKNDNWEFRADEDGSGIKKKFFQPDATPWPISGNPGDGKLQVYNREVDIVRQRGKVSLWSRYEFSLTPQQAHTLKFLHQEPLFWHRPHYSIQKIWLNGKEMKRLTRHKGTPADRDECFLLSGLKSGKNTLVIHGFGQPAPGYLFLAPTGPWRYPSNDPGKNRRYFDLTEFVANLRAQYVERRMRAFLAGDPAGRPQLVMACDSIFDLLIPIMKKYGGFPHDTGMMGATYCPWTTTYAIPHGIPISGEPGICASTAAQMDRYMCLWTAMGIESVNLLWAPRTYRHGENGAVGRLIEKKREEIRAWGKMEFPDAKIGVMRSVRNASRLGFSGGWNWDGTRGTLQETGRRGQLLDPADLISGIADRYPVILDAATELLTEEELAGIERYVHNGGTFIALHVTGMHSPERARSWPISRLTGLRPTTIQPLSDKITFLQDQKLWPSLCGKTIDSHGFAFDYTGKNQTGNELAMQALARDVKVIAEWENLPKQTGKIAVASRRIGKGRLIVLGSTFWRQARDSNGSWRHSPQSAHYLDELLHSLGIPRISTVSPAGKQVFAEKFRSKNGLYDLYLIVRPTSKAAEELFSVTFHTPAPAKLYNYLQPGHPEVSFHRNDDGSFTVSNLKLGPFGRALLAAPVADPANAPKRWLTSLAGRWQALPNSPETAAVRDRSRKQTPSPWIIPLTEGWKARVIPQEGKNVPLPEKTVRLGLFETMGFSPMDEVTFQKNIQLPKNWHDRRIQLLFQPGEWHYWGIRPAPRISINGKVIAMDFIRENTGQSIDLQQPADGRLNIEISINGRDKFKPIGKRFRPVGVAGIFFLLANPQPVKQLSLENWSVGMGLDQLTPVRPGATMPFRFLEQHFTVPEQWPKGELVLEIDGAYPLLGWLEINGRVLFSEAASIPFNQLPVSNLLNPPGKDNVIRWAPQESALSYLTPRHIYRIPIPRARLALWPDLPWAANNSKQL